MDSSLHSLKLSAVNTVTSFIKNSKWNWMSLFGSLRKAVPHLIYDIVPVDLYTVLSSVCLRSTSIDRHDIKTKINELTTPTMAQIAIMSPNTLLPHLLLSKTFLLQLALQHLRDISSMPQLPMPSELASAM
jgi:hypothetical protein